MSIFPSPTKEFNKIYAEFAVMPNVQIIPAPILNVSIIPAPAAELYDLYVEFHVYIRFRSGTRMYYSDK